MIESLILNHITTMKEGEKQLRLEFYKLEQFYRPYFDYLTEHQDEYPDYKGAVTIDGYLNYEPEVLLLSYNPANGKYRDWNKDGAHLVYTGERPFALFDKNHARINRDPEKDAEWWETDQKRHFSFLASTIDFIYAYKKAMNDGHIDYEKHKRPIWANKIEEQIMCLNIYPIATKNCTGLKRVFTKISKHTIPEIESKNNEWEIRKVFVSKMHSFIEGYVKPKAILCLGKQTISDYTYGKFEEIIDIDVDGVYRGKCINEAEDYTNIIGIDRSGSWTKRAEKAGELIAEIVKSKNNSTE